MKKTSILKLALTILFICTSCTSMKSKVDDKSSTKPEKILNSNETKEATNKKQAFNPYLPSYEYVPDGEPHVFNDRVYIYGSHDKFDGTAYCMNNYVTYSAPVNNLKEWRYEGVIYDKTKDPMNKDGKKNLWAPDIQQGPDGRYYLYYSFEFTGVIGVAVCDTPAGEFEFYGHVSYPNGDILGVNDGDAFSFDPGVLVDDDGKVYLYSGFAPTNEFIVNLIKTGMYTYEKPKDLKLEGGSVIELEKDMITVKKSPKLLFKKSGEAQGTGFEGHEFYEASSIRKIGKKYYFIYSSINSHELCYAVSDSPTEGFKYGGTIISNGDIFYKGRKPEDALNYWGNNHGGMVEADGKWYIFYHRQTNRHELSRQTCAEEIKIDKNGNIDQVEMTSSGLNGGPLLGIGVYEARIACNLFSSKGAIRYDYQKSDNFSEEHPYFTQEGEDRENNPNQYIANMRNGAVAGFKYFDFKNPKEISVKVRGKGKIIVSTELSSNIVAEIKLDSTKEWMDFKTSLTNISGKKPLYFKYEGDGSFDFISFELF